MHVFILEHLSVVELRLDGGQGFYSPSPGVDEVFLAYPYFIEEHPVWALYFSLHASTRKF